MLGRANVDEDDDVDDILTARDAIRLAEELGIVNTTDALRLKHTYELVTHFSQLELEDSDAQNIDESEAITALKSCVRSVLGRPKVEVARKFVEFRNALENETLLESGSRVELLKGSPYFFYKLTVSVLLNAVKKNKGANLEHSLANINVLVPAMWESLRDSEKWQIGYAYAEAYSDGIATVVGGLKSVLLKVKGFDYVPENLRSDTFVKAAQTLLKAHEGLNNFYNEPSAVKQLSKLGSTIPTPALPACMTALLSVTLGNFYGVSWAAQSEAKEMLSRVSGDRWQYYINNVLPSDIRILQKLNDKKPRSNWISFINTLQLSGIQIKNKDLGQLFQNTFEKNEEKLVKVAGKLVLTYYQGQKN